MAEVKTKKKRERTDHEGVDLATALGNPWRFRIVYACSLESLSPSQFVKKYGGEISNISRHFRDLVRWGFLEKVESVSGGEHRNAVKNVYRSTRRGARLDLKASEGIPQMLRRELSGVALGDFLEQVRAAIEADTFDADVERHVSWDALEVDMEGFRELSGWLDEILARLPALRAAAKERMAASGEEAIPTTVGLFSFRSPPLAETRRPERDVTGP